jgi:hypothetical protein
LAYLDYGAADDADLDDREVWQQTNPAMPIRISEEFIERERAAMSDEGFARERLGIWPKMAGESWQVIKEADWRAAEDEGSQIDGAVAFAIEVSFPDRAFTTIAAAGFRPDGKTHVEVIDHQRGTGWVVARLQELVEKYEPCAVVVDAGGLAGSLIPDIEAVGIEVTKPASRDVAAAAGSLYDSVASDEKARDLVHIGQAELTSAVAGAAKRPLSDGWAWDRRNHYTVISPLVAVSLAKWGFDAFGQAGTPFFGAWR